MVQMFHFLVKDIKHLVQLDGQLSGGMDGGKHD